MSIDSHTTTTPPGSTAAPAVDPAPTEPHSAPDSDDSSAAPSLKLDIPSGALPSSSAAISSEPSSPVPLAVDSGSGSTSTDTAASSESPHTSLSASLSASLSSSSSSLPPVPPSGLNVKFAPLPQLAPRKRRSTAPLGMAARGQLVRGQQHRRRTALAESGGVVPPHAALPPDVVLTPAQLEGLRLQQEAAAARYAHMQGSAHALAARETEAEVIEEEAAREARAREKAERERERGAERERGGERDGAHGEEDEDPLLALGKAVKGVGRFWRRRVGSRDDADASLHKDGVRPGGVVKRRKSDLGRHSTSAAEAVASSSSTPPPVPPIPLRPILANITTNITPDASRSQSPLGDDAATIVPQRSAKPKDGAEGEHVDGDEDERTPKYDERIPEDRRGQEAREQEEEEEQGGVWEEEIGDGIPINAGQTQTIVGGRVVASVVSVASATSTSGASISTPTTTTTTTIEVTATATATGPKAHGKKDGGGGKKDSAPHVKSSMRSSLMRRGKAHIGGAQA